MEDTMPGGKKKRLAYGGGKFVAIGNFSQWIF
jgi:hypothetical protein